MPSPGPCVHTHVCSCGHTCAYTTHLQHTCTHQGPCLGTLFYSSPAIALWRGMAPIVGDAGVGGEALTVTGSFSLSWDLDSRSVWLYCEVFFVCVCVWGGSYIPLSCWLAPIHVWPETHPLTFSRTQHPRYSLYLYPGLFHWFWSPCGHLPKSFLIENKWTKPKISSMSLSEFHDYGELECCRFKAIFFFQPRVSTHMSDLTSL